MFEINPYRSLKTLHKVLDIIVLTIKITVFTNIID